jgi:uncharacterized membrane protein YdjX (TVP38/TMEM64 family)
MEISEATKRQLVSLGAVGVVLLGLAITFSPSTVADAVASLSDDPLLLLAVLAVLYLVRPFVMWPISALSLTVGFVLGAKWGIPVAIAGTVASNTVVFLLARYARTDVGVLGLASRSGDRLVEKTGQLRGVLAARLSPLPADVVSTAAGLSEVSLGSYVLGTLVGESPWIAAEVIAGSSMHTLSVHGLSHSLSLMAGATAFAAVLLARPLYRELSDRDVAVRG